MPHLGHSRRYSIGLLMIALAIIAIGIALRPKEKRQPTPVSELESAHLQRLAQERRLQELGDYISYAAQNAAKGLIYLADLEQTAVALDRGTAATGIRRTSQTAVQAISASGDNIKLNVQARRPDVPVLLLQPAGDVALVVPPRGAVDTGDWVVAVALREDGAPVFAYGLYESSVDARCGPFTYTRLRASIPLTSAFIGGGMFTLRGALAGIVARCENEVVVLSVASVTAALEKPVAPNAWLEDRYGLRVQRADPAGLDVITVWNSSPAEQAGILPGDQITQVDDNAVATEAEAVTTLGSSDDHNVTLLRKRRSIRVRLAIAPPPGEIHVPSAGMELADDPKGIIVRSVRNDGLAARGGILTGDLIRRIGTTPVTSALAVANTLAQGSPPVQLTLERNGSSYDVRLVP